jgi:hypothetical protein
MRAHVDRYPAPESIAARCMENSSESDAKPRMSAVCLAFGTLCPPTVQCNTPAAQAPPSISMKVSRAMRKLSTAAGTPQ